MSVIELIDVKTKPDDFYPYSIETKSLAVPLVIDNGSYRCRVGWANLPEPMLEFRNHIAKPRKDRNKKDGDSPLSPTIQVGNDILNIEAMRFQLKTQFDRNVVTHYHNQEQIYDYIFNHLSITGDGGVPHPILLTECFANPNYSRQLMSELLFECYDVPAVGYGIDALFSFAHNHPTSQEGLIISFGYHTTHIIPILGGQVVGSGLRRLNIGGFHMINYLHRLLQLKYPVHTTAVTLSRIESLLHNHCSVAVDYAESLRSWATYEYYESNVKKIQLSFNAPVASIAMTAEQKIEKKREMAKRLSDINARKREEKLADDEINVQKMLTIREMYEDGDHEEFEYSIKQIGISSYEDLEAQIQSTVSKIDRTKTKIAQLDSQQICFEDARTNITIPQPPPELNVDEWVQQTRQKRTNILERRQIRRQRKHDLAKRRTAAAQERMRVISHLARKEKGTDDFGMRDEDWDVYKTISKEKGDSDSEAENERLVDCEEVLRHHDPEYEKDAVLAGNSNNAAELYQLHVGVESIRATEIIFQPSMIGSGEAGIGETIEFVLKLFSSHDQELLVSNVFLTGGCASFPGLYDRLDRELREMRPFQSSYNIQVAAKPSQNAWHGACGVANSNDLDDILITKQDYEEQGGEYLRSHRFGNIYHPTPAPILVDPVPTSMIE